MPLRGIPADEIGLGARNRSPDDAPTLRSRFGPGVSKPAMEFGSGGPGYPRLSLLLPWGRQARRADSLFIRHPSRRVAAV